MSYVSSLLQSSENNRGNGYSAFWKLKKHKKALELRIIRKNLKQSGKSHGILELSKQILLFTTSNFFILSNLIHRIRTNFNLYYLQQ